MDTVAERIQWETERRRRETELREVLSEIEWPIEYGAVRIQIREWAATLVTIESTMRLD